MLGRVIDAEVSRQILYQFYMQGTCSVIEKKDGRHRKIFDSRRNIVWGRHKGRSRSPSCQHQGKLSAESDPEAGRGAYTYQCLSEE